MQQDCRKEAERADKTLTKHKINFHLAPQQGTPDTNYSLATVGSVLQGKQSCMKLVDLAKEFAREPRVIL